MQVEASATQTATPGTEHVLASTTTAHVRVLIVDVAALAGTESVELRVYATVLSAGTQRLALPPVTFGVGELAPNTQSPPVVMPFAGTFTLKQIGGTGRIFPWSVVNLD